MTTVSTDPGRDEPHASPDGASSDRLRASRRQLFKLGAAAAAASVVAPRRAGAQSARPRGRPPIMGPIDPPISGSAIASWQNPSVRLARRIGLGLTEAEAARARKMGYRGYLEYQLDHTSIDDSAVEAYVAQNHPMVNQDSASLQSADINVVTQQLQAAFTYRAAFSNRQLHARMVEFWNDHFSIYMRKVGYLKVADDRDVIRKHALGKFPDLLKASAHSPAMLVYLDQQTSRRGAPNQNYAREIMELHTLGVDGGYTQQDVAELSRVLTGWTITGRGAFNYDPNLHDFGAKTVLGVQIPASTQSATNTGLAEGERMLDVLVAHPSTAKFISKKMLKWLLRYDPSEAQIAGVAAVYTRTGGDIKEMIRAILEPSALMASPAKFKRPFHFLVSAIRATNARVTNVTNYATRQLGVVGQPLFSWETPDGYPDTVEYWAGNILPRWNFGTTIATAASGELVVDVDAYVQAGTAEGVTAAIGRAMFGGEMPASLRDALVAYLRPAPTNQTRVREALALAIASSQFQLY